MVKLNDQDWDTLDLLSFTGPNTGVEEGRRFDRSAQRLITLGLVSKQDGKYQLTELGIQTVIDFTQEDEYEDGL